MQKVTPLKVPLDVHDNLTPTSGDLLHNPHPYQSLLGKLIYLTVTRPDITFSVHVLSQYMEKPTTSHMQIATRVLRYLAGNPSQGSYWPLHLLCNCKHTVTVTGLVAQSLEDQLLDFAFYSATLLSRGSPRNSQL